MIRVLVLRLSVVSAHPVPLRLERRDGCNGALPEWKVFDGTTFASPSSRNPRRHPRPHSFDNVLRVTCEDDAELAFHFRQLAEGLDHRAKSHAIVGGRRLGNPVIPADELARFLVHEFDEPACAAGIGTFASVTEAGFIGV